MQLERAVRWWLKSRPAAPDSIADDLEEAKTFLAQQPGVDAKSASPRCPDLRRLFLSRVKYHVYYRVAPGKVIVLAF